MQIDGIENLIEGSSQTQAATIVMIHGWPDTHHLWDAQVAALSKQFRCVRFTLPGFDKDQGQAGDLVQNIHQRQHVLSVLHSPDWQTGFLPALVAIQATMPDVVCLRAQKTIYVSLIEVARSARRI